MAARGSGVEIWYETHAITTDNERGIATGWLPGRLSERGRALAPEIGERCRARGVEIVYVSDLARATETAALALGSSLPVRVDARLRECDYGDLNGAPVARIDRERRHRIDVPFPGGQSYRDVVDQTASLLRELAGEAYATVALIGHSANRWALDHLLTGAALSDLVVAPFAWQDGWRYHLPEDWPASR